MREIYTAPTVAAAETRFSEFAHDWEDTYPAMIRSWQNSWDEFVPFLEFPPSCDESCTPPTPSRASTPDSEERSAIEGTSPTNRQR